MSVFDERDDTASACDPVAESPIRIASQGSSCDLAALVDALPRLGSVLWLEPRAHARGSSSSATAHGGLRIDHPLLVPPAHCAELRAYQRITSAGPREWLEFNAASGRPAAKLFLLPDTDYLAWDELTLRCGVTPLATPASRWSAHAAFLRNAIARLGSTWHARVIAFERKRMPWLRTLDARTPLRLSMLGIEVARAIARDEGAELLPYAQR